ncbi:RNA polymerase subunit sigma [Bacillus wiedmannii]|uniref:RNA polymerase sigma factor n=1 Tax=Bacillus wiedmannii TaxID=1890302 RepID=UPI000BF9844C|nr:RNA polymerase sigma factor [Bacillus wiedmannii]PEP25461.1 RNA polymerase subunit sigma [Bacillus wiedmannii]PEP94445.1 RNA polymerase subunit sigma [Bacillus wiedmannii]PFY72300.1 RNA polymerase subunit sigma [Bacillus wiedmannii]PHF06392.1 RNA polymerase subunit sigma [Bacillus wiedmannii]PHF94331.1 RNA polymerase subunit sigma [Bacillus wiedmannii]
MKVTNNDYEQMEELYELYEQKIYYVAYSILNNIQQAEDAVQETFITLYKNLEKLHSLATQELKRYILRIAKNKAIDSYRKNKRHETFLEEYERESIEAVDENIEEWEKRKMSEVQIDTLLTELSESNRQVFKYKVFYNLTYQEILSVMGITEGNARKQFERARKRVQNMIGGIQHDEFKELQRNI